jgi:hypothetical protein
MDGSHYGLTSDDSLYYRYNSTMRARVPEDVELWADYSRILDSALHKLPSQEAIVYRGFHVSLTQVSHEFQPGKVVWLVSITSTTTDEKHTLKIFGSGSSSSPGTLMKIHALSAKDIKAFSVLPAESELVFCLNTCLSIERVITSHELMSLKGLIEDIPENVDLIVAREQHVSKDTVTSAVVKDAHDLTVFKSQHFASLSPSLSTHHIAFAAVSAPPATSTSSAPAAAPLHSLSDLSVSDVALIVRAAARVVCCTLSLHWQVSCKGAAFAAYSAAIMSNSFGGDVIDMLDMDEVTQYMESMGIAAHHRLLLTRTFATWKKNPEAAFEALIAAKVARATHPRELQRVI